MSFNKLPIILAFAFISSFCGQMFGLGGGFIYGPVLLALGGHPQVVASTLLYMQVFTTSVSTIMFGIFGRLIVKYTLWLAIFTGFGVIFGLFVIKKAMQRYNRPSMIVFALFIINLLSMVLSFFGNITRLKEQYANGVDLMKGDPIC